MMNKIKLTTTRCPNCGDMLSGAKVYKKKPSYRIRAVQVDRDFAVRTLEGVMKGGKGDYLCEGTNGERWPVKKEIFESTFILADETEQPTTKPTQS